MLDKKLDLLLIFHLSLPYDTNLENNIYVIFLPFRRNFTSDKCQSELKDDWSRLFFFNIFSCPGYLHGRSIHLPNKLIYRNLKSSGNFGISRQIDYGIVILSF